MNLPDRIGPYTPLRKIGAGGMGTVYFARQPGTGLPLAVKTLHQDSAAEPMYRARFSREVAVLRRVSGPYVIPLTDADTEASVPWLAMPYVPGDTLEAYLHNHGPLRGANLVTFASAVAHALACIHAAGVAHRDLKPSNIILAPDGPRVLDFGIAHHQDAASITTAYGPMGSPGWLAPEQLAHGVTTPACDVFAWGMIVALAASGAHPFGTPTGINHRISAGEPALSGLPKALLPLVASALAKQPTQRPTAAVLVERASALHGPDATRVLPTVAYTLPLEQRTEAATVRLDPARWDIPEPAIDLTRSLPYNPPAGATPVAAGSATRVRTGNRTRRGADDRSPGPAGRTGRPPAASQQQVPLRKRSIRRFTLRAALAVTTAGAVTVGAVVANAHGHAAANPPAAPQTASRAASTPVTTPAGPPSSASASPSAASVPSTTVSMLLGGLHATVPGTWSAAEVLPGALAAQDGMDAQYAMDLSPNEANGSSDTPAADGSIAPAISPAGLAVEWAPTMTSIDGGAHGVRSPHFGLFSTLFSTGGESAEQASSDDPPIATPQLAVTGASRSRAVTVAGEQADTWTVRVDTVPDYNRGHTSAHQIWFLPHSHYVIYTYGVLTPAQNTAAEAIVDSLRFTTTAMPLDCADSILVLDAAAAGNTNYSDGTDSSGNCGSLTYGQDTFEGATTSPIDAGTVTTRTEPECLTLVVTFDTTTVMNGGATAAHAYASARAACDLPRKP